MNTNKIYLMIGCSLITITIAIVSIMYFSIMPYPETPVQKINILVSSPPQYYIATTLLEGTAIDAVTIKYQSYHEHNPPDRMELIHKLRSTNPELWWQESSDNIADMDRISAICTKKPATFRSNKAGTHPWLNPSYVKSEILNCSNHLLAHIDPIYHEIISLNTTKLLEKLEQYQKKWTEAMASIHNSTLYSLYPILENFAEHFNLHTESLCHCHEDPHLSKLKPFCQQTPNIKVLFIDNIHWQSKNLHTLSKKLKLTLAMIDPNSNDVLGAIDSLVSIICTHLS